MKDKTTIIFCMGRELLEGAVLDRNANFMASHVSSLGFRVRAIHVVDNVEDEAVTAYQQALELKPAYMFFTGGMGPGHDDITRRCVARALGVDLSLDERAKELLAKSYHRLHAKGTVRSGELTEERLEMARIPAGAACFENPIGTAPAVRIEHGETILFLLPGAPEELRRMFTQYVTPMLESDGPGVYRDSRSLEYPGGDESAISRMLADLARRHPQVICRARLQGSEENLSIRITLAAEVQAKDTLTSVLDNADADLRARLGLEMGRAGEGFGE